MTIWPLRVIKMSINKRKKTLLSFLLLIGLVYSIVQLTYYQQAYSPLRVLANAESEAQRLLKFITLYHYQCNSTIGTSNGTSWRVCTEPDIGINVESSAAKIGYSLGPFKDYAFEMMLANYSFQQYIFIHYPMPPLLKTLNNSHIFKTIIVPNDPADFGRNSFDTQTLNSVVDNLAHSHIDLLKLESYVDIEDSHETLFFLVKDGVLQKVQQLHVVLDVDKIDDDYLYKWYRSLYVLFHDAGFRLYHTSASDPLCLQVTMMESCRYFMSWVRNPGPTTFIVYPPAIDGSYELESKRILDFLEEKEPDCHENVEFWITAVNRINICADMLKKKSDKQCNILVFGAKGSMQAPSEAVLKKCKITRFLPVATASGIDFHVYRGSEDRDFLPASSSESLSDIMSQYLHAKHINIIYMSISQIWEVLTPLLDTGALELVDQFIADIVVFDMNSGKSAVDIRRKYSELKRIEAFMFKVYEITPFMSNTLLFQKHMAEDCCFRTSFVKYNL